MSKKPLRTDEIQGAIVHEYDGIEEADNDLPRWWLAVFLLTAVFAVGYWFYYHELKVEPGPAEALIAEQKAVKAAFPVSAPVDEAQLKVELAAMMKDPAALDAGAKIFAANCVACHKAQGEGNIGPNLTDNFYIHGGSPVAIHKVISEGVIVKGMLAWGPQLGPAAVKQVAAYVVSLRGKNVPGKPPQGEEYAGE